MDCECQQGKDPDGSDSRKTFIILVSTCSVVGFVFLLLFFLFFFFSFPLPPVVVVNFIGTMKSI